MAIWLKFVAALSMQPGTACVTGPHTKCRVVVQSTCSQLNVNVL